MPESDQRKRDKTQRLAIIASAPPGHDGGQNIAVHSMLLIYSKLFDLIDFVWLDNNNSSNVDFSVYGNGSITVHRIQIPTWPIWLRFLRSLFSLYPAVCQKYLRYQPEVQKVISDLIQTGDDLYVAIEDIPQAVLVMKLKQEFPQIPCGVRSHNILAVGFEGMTQQGNLFKRWLWKLEYHRIKRFERKVIGTADRFWAISKSDQIAHERIYGKPLDGVLDVIFDGVEAIDPEAGDPQTVLHIGRLDQRKQMGVAQFVKHCWPIIRAKNNNAKLMLAGKGSEQFDDPSKGIVGLGYIENQDDFLRQGRIMINPQWIGSGIQLKSLIALLSGRVLVSTSTGAQGIEGLEDRKHFFLANGWDKMAEVVCECIDQPQMANQVALQGQDLAKTYFSEENFYSRCLPLLKEFVSNAGKK